VVVSSLLQKIKIEVLGWLSWLSIQLLISAQVLISGLVFQPRVGLRAGHEAY